MPRIARVVVPQYPHHITQRGTNKLEIFIDNEDRHHFLKLLNELTNKTESEVGAYCLMDNHFHLLISPNSRDGLGQCLHGTTFRYAQYFNMKYSRSGRLWQNRYFSCPIDKNEYYWAVVKYIEMNPVRAGIVKKPELWDWSSASEHIKGEHDGKINLHKWSKEDREQYMELILDEKNENNIRKATSTGRPLGGVNFFEKLRGILNRDLSRKKGGRPRNKKQNQ
ncbi:transposase and inactivated derivative [Candidatus Scalindua japonica]|uniref:Transposase and inactivated derivative n=1 Tax=Candidatus Scalindua japonica TaxID=1284222 RepID=A0A286U3F3_9BACT|nr:transposase [Candidatus Scalindua japonica]GAX62655.1 transposase and inactivated derivative [Candidatus Scalindua japonica]